MEYVTKPWAHQRELIDVVKDRNYYALLWDMGTGKTKTGIDIMRQNFLTHKQAFPTLIVCPLAVVENWKREILTHSHIEERRIQVIDGVTKPDGTKLKNPQKKLRLEQCRNEEAFIVIVNTENVSNADVWDLMLERRFEQLIVDESHRFKAHNGKRVKNLHKLCQQAQLRYRYILTGTPILQSALDLWAQYYILNPYILGGNYFSFRSTYFYDKNAGMPSHVHYPNWVPKDAAYYRAMGIEGEATNTALHNVIYEHSSRVMKDDVLDLPERTYQTLSVPMSKEQSRIYKDMERDCVAFLKQDTYHGLEINEDETLPEYMKADLAITKILRMQQLVCGIFTNAEGEVSSIQTPRLKVLGELLEELLVEPTNKIVIWTHFTPTYSYIRQTCSEVGASYVLLTGQQSKDQKQEAIDLFNENKEIRVMIANQGAGGTGVNLTAANYDIYYSRSFNLEHDLQSNARTHRGGQTRKTTRIDLVTPGTIDEDILHALSKKRANAEDILAAQSKEFKKEEILRMISRN